MTSKEYKSVIKNPALFAKKFAGYKAYVDGYYRGIIIGYSNKVILISSRCWGIYFYPSREGYETFIPSEAKGVYQWEVAKIIELRK